MCVVTVQYVSRYNTLFAITYYDVFWVACLHHPAVTATNKAVRMMPECIFTVHADCRVRIIPLIGGIILKTPPSLYRIDFIILNMNLLLQLIGLNYYVYIMHFF